MRKSHLMILPILILTLAMSMTASAFAGEMPAAAQQQVSGVVNINTADAAQLAYLPRVGAKAAQRIIAYRTEHGPFTKTTDLMQVKGFGDKSYQRLSSYLTVDGKTTLAAKVSSPKKPRAKKVRQQPATSAAK